MTKINYNPKYESIFDPRNIDDDCDKIASLIDNEGELIKDALEAGMYKQAVTMYLQLLKVASKREQYQVLLEHCRA